MTQKNAEHSKAVAGLMSEAAGSVREAKQRLDQMVSSMNDITGSSDRISKIIKVIDETAFQTNILALNAAVEAARAGEAGMGFAVVANEVRGLAQRSAQAAKDTTSLIEESITTSRQGSGRLTEVTTAIQRVTELSDKVKPPLPCGRWTRSLKGAPRALKRAPPPAGSCAGNRKAWTILSGVWRV